MERWQLVWYRLLIQRLDGQHHRVISGFLATGSLRASLLQIVLIVVDVLLYLPFVANVEKRFKAQEEN